MGIHGINNPHILFDIIRIPSIWKKPEDITADVILVWLCGVTQPSDDPVEVFPMFRRTAASAWYKVGWQTLVEKSSQGDGHVEPHRGPSNEQVTVYSIILKVVFPLSQSDSVDLSMSAMPFDSTPCRQ